MLYSDAKKRFPKSISGFQYFRTFSELAESIMPEYQEHVREITVRWMARNGLLIIANLGLYKKNYKMVSIFRCVPHLTGHDFRKYSKEAMKDHAERKANKVS
jgi:hypothetical protein